MKALVLFGHPNPNSYNGAVRDAVVTELQNTGAEVKVKDLYQMNFNPLLTVNDFQQLHAGSPPEDVKSEQDAISWADMIIMVSPVWWMSVTSMLRGYIDRVFSYGFAYQYTATGPQGLLTGKRGLLITTSGSNQQADQHTRMTDTIRYTFTGGFFGFCGITEADYLNLYDVVNVSDDERKQMLEEAKNFVRSKIK
ncbi:MAG: NAD(P)H-dependent oxidoreductase [Methylocystaceae bacterium]